MGITLKLDPLVSQIIVTTDFDNFTTADVRSLYLFLKKDFSLDHSTVRKKIYGELLKLVNKGWLKKITSKKKGATRFCKTELFDLEARTLNEKNEATSSIKKEDEKQKQLLDKLKHYKADLLLNIGESEAYKDLYSEFPELIDEIQPKYNKARDNNTKLLGKIRAIEGLMKNDKCVKV